MPHVNVVGEELKFNTGNYSNKIMYSDKNRCCHGQTAGMVFAGWRQKSNSKPLVVKRQQVDTLACL